MSLLKRLLGRPRFRKHADTFTASRAVVHQQLGRWIELCLAKQQHVLLLTHFESTFADTVGSLEQAEIDFEIISEPTLADQLTAQMRIAPPGVWLTMPDVLDYSPRHGQTEFIDLNLAIIVLERHPMVVHDEKVERFAREMGGRVEMGYFLSLEDPVIRAVINRRTIELLKQLGLGQNDLVSSHMTSRALEKMLRRVTDQVQEESPAHSPEEWFELNLSSSANDG